jgi:hypothetical protein
METRKPGPNEKRWIARMRSLLSTVPDGIVLWMDNGSFDLHLLDTNSKVEVGSSIPTKIQQGDDADDVYARLIAAIEIKSR